MNGVKRVRLCTIYNIFTSILTSIAMRNASVGSSPRGLCRSSEDNPPSWRRSGVSGRAGGLVACKEGVMRDVLPPLTIFPRHFITCMKVGGQISKGPGGESQPSV